MPQGRRATLRVALRSSQCQHPSPHRHEVTHHASTSSPPKQCVPQPLFRPLWEREPGRRSGSGVGKAFLCSPCPQLCLNG